MLFSMLNFNDILLKVETIFYTKQEKYCQWDLRDAPHAVSLHSSPRKIPFWPSFAESSDSQNFLAGKS